jgi:hypothetical protein
VAARAYWKGYLKLSLVSCPIALFPATSEREKISFHQLNKETGNRVRYRKVDAESGDEVPQENIIKGYEVSKGEYIELGPEDLEAVAIDSKRILEIDEFVPKNICAIPITSCRTATSGNRPLLSSATPSANKAWWRWARSCSRPASTSLRLKPATRAWWASRSAIPTKFGRRKTIST